MKKLLATSLLLAFFFITDVTLFASQEDLYGTWVGEFTEDDTIVILKFQFNEAVLIAMEICMYDNEILEQEEYSIEIIDWKEKVNNDNETRNSYPNGYILELNGPLESIFLELYISGDKKQFTVPEFNEETNEIVAFIKQ